MSSIVGTDLFKTSLSSVAMEVLYRRRLFDCSFLPEARLREIVRTGKAPELEATAVLEVPTIVRESQAPTETNAWRERTVMSGIILRGPLPWLLREGPTTEFEYVVDYEMGGTVAWLQGRPTCVLPEIDASVHANTLRRFFWVEKHSSAQDVRDVANAARKQLDTIFDVLAADIAVEVEHEWPSIVRFHAQKELDAITLRQQ